MHDDKDNREALKRLGPCAQRPAEGPWPVHAGPHVEQGRILEELRQQRALGACREDSRRRQG